MYLECFLRTCLHHVLSLHFDHWSQVYAISGSAKDIRALVMELNAKRALTEDSVDEDVGSQPRTRAAAGPASQARHGQWEDFVYEVSD